MARTVQELVAEARGRIEEIARMLSGDTEQVSIDHARALLEEAGTLD